MKKIGILVFIAALILGISIAGLCSWGKASAKFVDVSFNIGGVRGSGNSVTERRDLRDFRSIDVSGVFEVEAVAQRDFSVEVEGDDNLTQFVKTEVVNGVLRISTTKNLKPRTGLRIRVAAPTFDEVEASGAAKINVAQLAGESFKLDTSGASKVELNGDVRQFSVDVSGASKINAENLKANRVTVDSSGASKIDVYASESLNVKASGASKITYAGGAKDVVKNISGVGKVTER